MDETALDYAEVKALCAGNPNTTRGACEKGRFYVDEKITIHIVEKNGTSFL